MTGPLIQRQIADQSGLHVSQYQTGVSCWFPIRPVSCRSCPWSGTFHCAAGRSFGAAEVKSLKYLQSCSADYFRAEGGWWGGRRFSLIWSRCWTLKEQTDELRPDSTVFYCVCLHAAAGPGLRFGSDLIVVLSHL